MHKSMGPLIMLLVGAAVMLWLLSLAKPSSPSAWINLGVVLLLPNILAGALVQGLSERMSGRQLLILTLVPMLIGLTIAVSPYLGKPDAQGGLVLLLAPIVQLIALGITVKLLTKRRKRPD
jgi:peptidoglycan/LPS O-acetylase OafA/YrhL